MALFYQELRIKHGLNRFAKVQCGQRLAIPEKCQLGSGRVDLGGLRSANPALFKNVGSGGSSGKSKKARSGSTDSKKEKKKPGRPAGSTNKNSQETKKKKPESKAKTQSKETIR